MPDKKNRAIYIDSELDARMKAADDTNWAQVASEAFEQQLKPARRKTVSARTFFLRPSGDVAFSDVSPLWDEDNAGEELLPKGCGSHVKLRWAAVCFMTDIGPEHVVSVHDDILGHGQITVYFWEEADV